MCQKVVHTQGEDTYPYSVDLSDTYLLESGASWRERLDSGCSVALWTSPFVVGREMISESPEGTKGRRNSEADFEGGGGIQAGTKAGASGFKRLC